MCSLVRPILGLGLVAASTAGCGLFEPPPPLPPFKAAVNVVGDPGQHLAGAIVKHGDDVLGTTNADGRVDLTFNGAEGDHRDVSVTCPEGHQQPSKPIPIVIRRIAGAVSQFDVSCPPSRRKLVVAVRADNGAHLPVVYLNEVVATTDDAGVAHFALNLEPGTFRVKLDTSSVKGIKPESPEQTFTVGQKDDIFVMSQSFQLPKKVIYVKPPPSAPRQIGEAPRRRI